MTSRSLPAQLALASLLSLAVVDILFVLLVAVDVLSGDEALTVATPKMIYFSLMAGISFFALPLAWWGNRIGYYVAMAVATISLLASASGIWAAVTGVVPVDVNMLSGLVGLVLSGILLVSSGIASREKAV